LRPPAASFETSHMVSFQIIGISAIAYNKIL